MQNGKKCGKITAETPEPLIFHGFRRFLLLLCYKFNIKLTVNKCKVQFFLQPKQHLLDLFDRWNKRPLDAQK